MRIQFLSDGRNRELLGRALKGLDPNVRSKVERSLKTLERLTWQEALESNLISRLGKTDGNTVWEIKIRGKPHYRIAAALTNHEGEQCLLVGDIATREHLEGGNKKEAFIEAAVQAHNRWIEKNRGH